MNKQNNRIMLGLILTVLSVLGFSWFISAWAYPLMPMHRSDGDVRELTGTIIHVEENEVEIETNGLDVEMHGPSWFWQYITIQEGDSITALGVFTTMMEHGKGWHETFIPYQITLYDQTFGNVNQSIPVWMQT